MSQSPTRRRRRSWPRRLLLTVFAAAALIGVYSLIVRKPQVPQSADPSSPVQTAGQTVDQAAASEAEGADRTERKDSFFTILLSGMDDDNGGSDTNILIGFDADGGAIRCVSIPRDTGVYYNGKARKVNVPSKSGVDALADTLSDALGIPVDFTVQVDLKGFVKLVDAIGGVEFYVPIDMDYDDPIQNLSIHFSKGTQYLNGTDALKVVRFRHNNDKTGYGTEDLGRIGTQQAFLKAVAKKMLANPQKIGEYAKIFTEYVDTTLKVSELAWLGEKAVLIGLDNLSFETLPGAWSDRRSLYLPDPDGVLEMVNASLNPYVLDRTADELNLVT
jgi:LCP family protein required for cell wall assembly